MYVGIYVRTYVTPVPVVPDVRTYVRVRMSRARCALMYVRMSSYTPQQLDTYARTYVTPVDQVCPGAHPAAFAKLIAVRCALVGGGAPARSK